MLLALAFAVAARVEPQALNLSPAEDHALQGVLTVWNQKKLVATAPLVVTNESFPCLPRAIPSIRLEILRHGIDAQTADTLIAGLGRGSPFIQSPALESTTRIRFADILLRAMDPKTRTDPALANVFIVLSLGVPSAAGDSAVVLYGVGAQMTNTLYGIVRLAFVKRGVQVWEEELSARGLGAYDNIEAIPHFAAFTADDLGIITAVLDRRFPDRTQTPLIINETLETPALFIPELKVGRAVTFVPRERLGSPGVIKVSRPVYGEDRRTATVRYLLGHGSATATLLQTQSGWTIASDSYAEPVIDLSSPLRVGGDVKAPLATSRPQPNFAPGPRRGVLIIELTIDRDGRVKDATVLKPLRPEDSQIALEAVKQWRFQPGTLDGKPVAVLYNVVISVP